MAPPLFTGQPRRMIVEIAQLLIRAGANASARTRYGATPLTMASLNGNAALIEMLLKAGADPNTATAEGETVLMIAARTGVCRRRQDAARPWSESKCQGRLPRSVCPDVGRSEGHLEAVEALLEAGADIKARSSQGWTALLFAARDGRMEVAGLYLMREPTRTRAWTGPAGPARWGAAAPVAQATARGASALLLAVGSNHYELAAYLLDRGADPNSANEGWTACIRSRGCASHRRPASAGPAWVGQDGQPRTGKTACGTRRESECADDATGTDRNDRFQHDRRNTPDDGCKGCGCATDASACDAWRRSDAGERGQYNSPHGGGRGRDALSRRGRRDRQRRYRSRKARRGARQ